MCIVLRADVKVRDSYRFGDLYSITGLRAEGGGGLVCGAKRLCSLLILSEKSGQADKDDSNRDSIRYDR
jgi:hypothetical protein